MLDATSDYQYRTAVELLVALSTVVSGGVDEGLRRPTAVLDTVQPAFRTHEIVAAARRVSSAVPVEQRERPEAGDLREMLAIEQKA
ncbi:hypothetical protein [Nonomuraea sp. NPDC049129]|uniref:hypothetical protein n=1 Tax=Nonomuraea sp. NPDC049129 TaxID=3155272 RepID=UPI0033F1924D